MDVSVLAKNLAEQKEMLLKNEGASTTFAKEQVEKELDVIKAQKEMMTKANEVLNNSSETVGGALVPDSITMDQVVEMMRKQPTFLNALTPGFHGTGLQKNVDVPILGDIGFARGASEWTTGAFSYSQPTNQLPTDKVTIPQTKLYASVGVSDTLLKFSIIDVIAKLRQDASLMFTRTVADMVLNGDSTIASTGNINSDDQDPTTTFALTGGALDRRLLLDNGLRKQPINGNDGVDKKDIGTMTFDDVLELISYIDHVDPSDLFMVMDRKTRFKLAALDEFKDYSKNNTLSTITNGAVTNFHGVEVFYTDLMRLTEADGKLSGVTPSNNTKGQIIVAKRNVIQHGFGSALEFNFVKSLEKGVLFEATSRFGQANINKKAAETNPFITCGYNVTVA